MKKRTSLIVIILALFLSHFSFVWIQLDPFSVGFTFFKVSPFFGFKMGAGAGLNSLIVGYAIFVFYLLYQYDIAKVHKGLFYTTLCLAIFAVVHKVYEFILFVTADHHMADIRIGFILFLLCIGLHNKIYRGKEMSEKAD